MTSTSHRVCTSAIVAGLPLQKLTILMVGSPPTPGEFYWPTMVVFFSAMLFATAPDFVRSLFQERFYHFTHCLASIPVVIGLCILVAVLSDNGNVDALALGFALAWASHLFMDGLGTLGCPFTPMRDHPRLCADLYWDGEPSEVRVVWRVAGFGLLGVFVFQELTWREWAAAFNILRLLMRDGLAG